MQKPKDLLYFDIYAQNLKNSRDLKTAQTDQLTRIIILKYFF